MFTESGTKNFLKKCIKPFVPVVWPRTPQHSGITVSQEFAFLNLCRWIKWFLKKSSFFAGELGFFDNYIIPLAKKLKECKIFGVSSDEYLNYALQNRAEWQERGEEIVEEMKEECINPNPKSQLFSPRPRRRSSLGSCSVVDEEKKFEDMCLEVPLDVSRDTSRLDWAIAYESYIDFPFKLMNKITKRITYNCYLQYLIFLRHGTGMS